MAPAFTPAQAGAVIVIFVPLRVNVPFQLLEIVELVAKLNSILVIFMRSFRPLLTVNFAQ